MQTVRIAWLRGGVWVEKNLSPSALQGFVYNLRKTKTEYRYYFGGIPAIVYKSKYDGRKAKAKAKSTKTCQG